MANWLLGIGKRIAGRLVQPKRKQAAGPQQDYSGMSKTQIEHELELGHMLLHSARNARFVASLHDDPQRREFWHERISSNEKQLKEKVQSLERELARRGDSTGG